MRRLLAFVLLALLSGCHGTTARQDYRDRAGRFRVEAPGPLEELTSTPVTSLTLSHPGLRYGLRFHQASDGVLLRPLALQRDGLRDERLRQSQGELVSETPITLAGEYPSREVRVRRTGEARVLLRFDVVGRRA